jgi:hypothetical protein
MSTVKLYGINDVGHTAMLIIEPLVPEPSF